MSQFRTTCPEPLNSLTLPRLLVFRTAVAAQKIVDERHNPTHRYDGWWRNERRSRGGANLYVANSAYKGKEEGCVSSFKASRYYSAESAKRRDELLAKIKAED